jgi:hypothetical protein
MAVLAAYREGRRSSGGIHRSQGREEVTVAEMLTSRYSVALPGSEVDIRTQLATFFIIRSGKITQQPWTK